MKKPNKKSITLPKFDVNSENHHAGKLNKINMKAVPLQEHRQGTQKLDLLFYKLGDEAFITGTKLQDFHPFRWDHFGSIRSWKNAQDFRISFYSCRIFHFIKNQ